ncbi:hypothetical protein CRE_07265 [Caenorhabditis remanei]|uniref:receptor protein-tyrosine kinase n=1 Tax=Caenorhabditis remanei TaxID=31234 RepID=E3M2I6_CAERE|nr:hypothetical protein CRE_07265 [Caenorhabditis remanei]
MNAEEVTLSKSDLTAFGLQLADGIEFLARVPCVHRDLACRNILVTENKTIQIDDFGLAKKFNEKYCYKTQKGIYLPRPEKWMPLESINNDIFTEKSDVYSYGICLFEIFSFGKTPYPKVLAGKIAIFLENGGRNEKPKHCSDKEYDLMLKCWMNAPEDRPTFYECLQFFQEVSSNNVGCLFVNAAYDHFSVNWRSVFLLSLIAQKK